MREIKFRAHYNGAVYDVQQLQYGYRATNPPQPYVDAVWLKGFGRVNAASVDLMQYTGMEDKDGVGIYEGDVMLCACVTCVVYWNDGAWELTESLGRLTKGYAENYAVVGNIYENPELLESQETK